MPVTGHPGGRNRDVTGRLGFSTGRLGGSFRVRSHGPGEYGKSPSSRFTRRLKLLHAYPRTRMSFSSFCRATFLTLAAVLAAGCGHKVGDACSNSADCDPSGGTRTCDLSQPGGYCIVEGCDARSCPEDSVCGRFFPDQQFSQGAVPCAPGSTAPSGCMADEVCVADANLNNGTGASCIRASLEKRACVQTCGSDGDCRGGYVCRPFGICGAIQLTVDQNSTPKYCVPSLPASQSTSAGLCPIT